MSLAVLATLLQAGGSGAEGQTPGVGLPSGSPSVPSGSVGGLVTIPDIEWTALLPLLVLAGGAVVLLTLTSLARGKVGKSAYAIYTVLVATAAMATAIPLWGRVHGWTEVGKWEIAAPYGPFSAVAGAIGVDGFSIFLTLLICVAVILGALLADDYLRREGIDGPEYYVLMLLSAAGGVIMAMANDLIVLFLGLETLSIAVYVLAAIHLKRVQSQEAGLKYFVLGGFSSAFFLYGVAMVYGATGSTNLVQIKDQLATSIPTHNGLLLVGFGLMLVGLGFKVAAVPFHSWSPDVYDGAPTPVAAFMASGVKAAGFAGLVRVFVVGFGQYAADWQPVVYALAVLSMVVGAIVGITQTNVKRALAYSSIGHAGFMLMALEAATARGVSAILFYLATYTFMVVGSFGIATLAGNVGDGRHDLADYRGFSRTNPLLAGLFVVFLLGQSGFPLTSGFVAKFTSIAAAVDAGSWHLAVVAMLSAVASAFIYLRIIVAMYMAESDEAAAEPAPRAARIRIPFAAGLALWACVLATLGFGVLPNGLARVSDEGTPALVRDPLPPQEALPGGSNLGLPGGATVDPGVPEGP